jgi:hypothetical protein
MRFQDCPLCYQLKVRTCVCSRIIMDIVSTLARYQSEFVCHTSDRCNSRTSCCGEHAAMYGSPSSIIHHDLIIVQNDC